MDERVSLRAHFERYPASIKGAFVLRAADGVPHQVEFTSGRCIELSGGEGRDLGLRDAVVDAAPNLDLFVPFEFPSVELASGWYRLECDVVIDGTPSSVQPGSAFVVAWPRGTTRRGRVDVDAPVDAGTQKVQLLTLDLAADSLRLSYGAPEPVSVRLSADGRPLAMIEEEHDAEVGRGSVVAYPAMRDEGSVTVRLRGAHDTVEIPLP
jgi:hypothetical protein